MGLRQPATLQRVEEHLVDAKRTRVPFAITDENRFRVTRPRDVSARRRHLAFGSAQLRHGEDTVSVPHESDALSVWGPGGARFPRRSFCQSAKRFTVDGLYIDIC